MSVINDPTRGSLFGRIGRGIGQGISEQLPKEVERNRLSSGLKRFQENAANLSPMQQLAELSGIPGITPQMIQSFGELAKQQARGQALNAPSQPKPSPFPQNSSPSTGGNNIPSITQAVPLEKIQQGYIPKTQEEIFEDAGRMYNENPAKFNNDPQKAIEAAESSDIRNQAINQAYQKQHEVLSKLQENVVEGLKHHSSNLGTKVPPNLYSKIEDEAIQATKPVKEGGRGLTEQQAKKEFGLKLDQASRDYDQLNQVGNWGITGRSAAETLRSLKGLQKKFAENNDTENFASKLISQQQLSPQVAYSIASPVSNDREASKYLNSIPSLQSEETFFESKVPPSVSIPKTLEIISPLAKMLQKNDKLSPLAIAYELDKKGYDSQTWLDYLTENKDILNLRADQNRQINTPQPLISTWNDWWLSSWSGL